MFYASNFCKRPFNSKKTGGWKSSPIIGDYVDSTIKKKNFFMNDRAFLEATVLL